MLRARHWTALVLFSAWLGGGKVELRAQSSSSSGSTESTSGSTDLSGGIPVAPSTPSLGTPASSFGAPSTPPATGADPFGSSTTSPGSGTTTTTPSATQSPFSFGTGSDSPGGTTGARPDAGSNSSGIPSLIPDLPRFRGSGLPEASPTQPGGASTAASTEATSPAENQLQKATAFSVPGAYGQSTQVLTAGQGRLSRPRFQYSGSLSFGYDDNTLSTPYNGIDTKAVKQQVLVAEEIPAHFETVQDTRPRTPQVNGPRINFQVYVPKVPAKYKTVVVSPAVKAPEPVGSFAARANAGVDVQFANRRSVFTMSLLGNATYYPSRPGDPEQYNGSLNLIYAYRITPRLQFSATASLAYLSQPDLSRLNTPTQNLGDYFTGNLKTDLTYRWNPRFSTVTSFSLADQTYLEKLAADQGNFYQYTIGTEARWMWMPRLTLLGEVRYQGTQYVTNTTLNSNSYFLLAGGEITLSRKFTATARLGAEFRALEQDSKLSPAPYAETALNFRYSRTGVVSWGTRLGFEESNSATTNVLVLRSSINATQAFSVRTRGSLGFSAVHRVTTDDTGATDTVSENVFSIDLGLAYTYSKNITLTANYSLLNDISTQPGVDYLRNQIFFGAQYSF